MCLLNIDHSNNSKILFLQITYRMLAIVQEKENRIKTVFVFSDNHYLLSPCVLGTVVDAEDPTVNEFIIMYQLFLKARRVINSSHLTQCSRFCVEHLSNLSFALCYYYKKSAIIPILQVRKLRH